MSTRLITAWLALLLLSTPSLAHHRQTPPVVPLSQGGDNDLPRLAALSGTLALSAVQVGGHEVVRFYVGKLLTTRVSAAGDCEHPTVSGNGRAIAWDTDGDPLHSGDPGRQVYLESRGAILQAAHDPTGTSGNPALNHIGRVVAFESQGDLAGTGNPGARQVFVRAPDGSLRQVSRGAGSSGNPSFAKRGLVLAFDSTSDAATGTDTGVAQVWIDDPPTARTEPVTAGQGSSRRPALSPDARMVAFESTANLVGGGEDTGVTQVFVYDRVTRTLSQLTSAAGGCGKPSIDFYLADWRVVFSCGSRALYHEIVADTTYEVPIDTGDTPEALAVIGNNFIAVSTTANLTGSGTTPDHHLFLWNLYKLPARPVASPTIRVSYQPGS
jgi:Tol biopolymer transport system component